MRRSVHRSWKRGEMGGTHKASVPSLSLKHNLRRLTSHEIAVRMHTTVISQRTKVHIILGSTRFIN